jgi:MFS family permease
VSGPATKHTEKHGRSIIGAGAVSLSAGLALLAYEVADIGTGGSLALLVPGLLLAGAGVGMCFTPLTATVLATVDPQRAGAASGTMSTTQQVGYALGVAITGVVYFAADDAGDAFANSLVQLAILAAGVALVSRLLPQAAAGETARSAAHASA